MKLFRKRTSRAMEHLEHEDAIKEAFARGMTAGRLDVLASAYRKSVLTYECDFGTLRITVTVDDSEIPEHWRDETRKMFLADAKQSARPEGA